MNRFEDRIPRTPSTRVFFQVLLRRFPFTTLVVIAILVVTETTGSLARPISPPLLDHWGFGLEQIRSGRFYQLLFAPFQILRPYMAITITGIVILFVGACEYRLGTRRAMLAFWTGHLVGYVGALAVLSLLGRAGSEWALAAVNTVDVGASNGAFGAAGAVIAFFATRARRTSFFLVAVYLLITLVIQQKIWDLGHILAFSSGLAVGAFLLRRMGRDWPGLMPRWQIERRQRPIVVSWALRVGGVMNIMSAFLLPHHAGFARLESWLPLGSPHWPRHLLLVTGLVLVTLSPGLAKRQRPAWWGAVGSLLLSLILQLHVGITFFEAGLAATFLVLLVSWRGEFLAPADPPSLRSGLMLLGLLPIAVSLYGMIGFDVLRGQFQPPVTAYGAFVETFSRVVFSPVAMSVASGRPAEWFLGSIPLVAWLGVVYAVARIVRSVRAPEASTTDVAVARRLLRSWGNSGTSYMTLWKGNSLFFGPGRRCYVAYRVGAGVAFALGDPIGPPGESAETIEAFGRHADRHGWTPAFYATGAALLGEYHRAGYETLQIGEEAVIRLTGLEFRGKQWQGVRSASNRASKMGVAFRMFEGGRIPEPIRKQLFEISEDWAARQELPLMEFTLGRTEDIDDPNVNVAVALDASGRVHGYLDWLPVYGRRGWVLDIMQRREDAMSTAMDFLIGMSLLAFKERGYETASLATAPLADVDRAGNASPLQWLLGKVYENSRTLYDFKSLFHYKGKFLPAWEGVYLAHRGITTLPSVAAALARAYLPDLGVVEATRILGESSASRLFPRPPNTG